MKSFRLQALCVIVICSAACAVRAKVPPPQMEFVLGTVCSVNLYEDGSDKLYSRIFTRIREIDRTMSAVPGSQASGQEVSEVVRINRNAGIAPVRVSAELFDVLERALYYAELSGGAFDPTIGPLVMLWGIGTPAERIPDEAEIAGALSLVDWRDLVIDREAGTVFLRRPGMALDLGGIAKGYAADEAARLAREGGAWRGIFDLGGNILALGGRDNGGDNRGEAVPWRIGVQDPLGERGAYIGVLPVRDKSIVTSGIYERYFEAGGRRYHHILSTGDGRPVNNGLLSVTIIADYSIDADGLSTTVFALGYEKGRALVEALANTEAIFVFEDRTVKITAGIEGIFSLTVSNYTLCHKST
ncbi:MAG: FAD:protein FMN transferase [Treponema sp.]|jgi:thiamine biosynthesis lipoprotein|nr:FAD:protein FMN transferase [Treponema sp.]